jgi:hypothetical protein
VDDELPLNRVGGIDPSHICFGSVAIARQMLASHNTRMSEKLAVWLATVSLSPIGVDPQVAVGLKVMWTERN